MHRDWPTQKTDPLQIQCGPARRMCDLMNAPRDWPKRKKQPLKIHCFARNAARMNVTA
jgi:hypothetical protein